MKISQIIIGVFFFGTSIHGEVAITAIGHDRRLSWTNSQGIASYRIESAPSLAGPWSTVTSLGTIQGTNQQVTVQLPESTRSLELFRVAWVDAPPAEPVGTWDYQGFDPRGTLVVTGRVSIASSEPITGTCVMQSAVVNSTPLHPVGSGAFTNGTALDSHQIQIPLPTGFLADNFVLSGQMAGSEYWGKWSRTDSWIDLSGHSQVMVISGCFSARRSN